MKKVLAVLFCSLFVVSSAFAFGVPGLGGGGGSKSSASLDDAVSAQNDLVKAYVQGAKNNMEAQATMADALGLKEQSAVFTATAEGINESNAKDVPAEVAKTEDASKEIADALKNAKELSADSKKKVAMSLLPLAVSLTNYKVAGDKSKTSLEMAKSVIENASMMDKVKAKKQLDPVLAIAPKVPGDLAALASTAKNYIQFAKSNKIEVPKDVTKALGDL